MVPNSGYSTFGNSRFILSDDASLSGPRPLPDLRGRTVIDVRREAEQPAATPISDESRNVPPPTPPSQVDPTEVSRFMLSEEASQPSFTYFGNDGGFHLSDAPVTTHHYTHYAADPSTAPGVASVNGSARLRQPVNLDEHVTRAPPLSRLTDPEDFFDDDRPVGVHPPVQVFDPYDRVQSVGFIQPAAAFMSDQVYGRNAFDRTPAEREAMAGAIMHYDEDEDNYNGMEAEDFFDYPGDRG